MPNPSDLPLKAVVFLFGYNLMFLSGSCSKKKIKKRTVRMEGVRAPDCPVFAASFSLPVVFGLDGRPVLHLFYDVVVLPLIVLISLCAVVPLDGRAGLVCI